MFRPFVDDFLACLRFYSRLPVPAPRGHEMPDFRTAVRALPLAGALIALAPAWTLLAAHALGLPPFLAATLALAALVVVTGALHEDGLADLADGFGGGATREEKLEIMRDSRLGSYGALALMLSLALRLGALTTIAQRGVFEAAAILIFAASLSRTAGLLPIMILAPARADGAGHAAMRPFKEALQTAALLASAFSILPIALGVSPVAAVLAGALSIAAAYATAKLAERQIGGLTGDVLGGAQQAAEIAALLVFASGG
ncbi:cobalamin synthase [Methylosinus sp. R-45379]|uniref:adenosylcobinamide-GDP ribazoletransferase n=1 Tax=Methylosinus sp. R-45379 TaxID=980563 RepID=UPI0007C95094|nr:adenosylcobinamide-GDP ribazoletransferase [Methylosinus sp. R-45379]OAI29535.1 cobalamin synthase [Methylosinus sp. R-45379]